MSLDVVHYYDKQQSDPKQGIVCRADPRHGRMGVHKSGAYLLCGHKDCQYNEPTSTPVEGL